MLLSGVKAQPRHILTDIKIAPIVVPIEMHFKMKRCTIKSGDSRVKETAAGFTFLARTAPLCTLERQLTAISVCDKVPLKFHFKLQSLKHSRTKIKFCGYFNTYLYTTFYSNTFGRQRLKMREYDRGYANTFSSHWLSHSCEMDSWTGVAVAECAHCVAASRYPGLCSVQVVHSG